MAKGNQERITEVQNALATLETRVASLQQLTDKTDGRFQEIQVNKTEAQALKMQIQTLEQEATSLLAEIKETDTGARMHAEIIEALVESATESKETFETHSTALDEIEEKIRKFEEKISEQLGRAGAGALAVSFTTRQTDVEKELERWRGILFKSTGALIVVSVILFSYSIFETINAQFFLKLTVSFPFIYAVWFSGKQYNKERFIVERYAFKAAQAKSLAAFSLTVKEMNQSEEGQSVAQKFVVDSIGKIYIAPKLDEEGDEFPMFKIAEKLTDVLKEVTKIKS